MAQQAKARGHSAAVRRVSHVMDGLGRKSASMYTCRSDGFTSRALDKKKEETQAKICVIYKGWTGNNISILGMTD